jgi:hypothetical protein
MYNYNLPRYFYNLDGPWDQPLAPPDPPDSPSGLTGKAALEHRVVAQEGSLRVLPLS